MAINALEKFVMTQVSRTEIHGASYNPRKISAEAQKKLRADLKKFGLLGPIIVNKQTMNIVAGHQRIGIMDSLIRKPDYQLTVALVDLEEKDEVAANVLLNNQSTMGEWDIEKLAEIKDMLPDIDFQADLGFDQAQLDVMFAGMEGMEDIAPLFRPRQSEEEESEIERMKKADKYKEAKKKLRDNMAELGANGDTYSVEHDDYIVTFVFNNNAEKAEFMQRIKRPKGDRVVKASVLFDIAQGEYDLINPIKLVRNGTK